MGSTVNKVPLVYRNIGKVIEGREGRTVELDAEREPPLSWAFEAYANDEWTINQLNAEMTGRVSEAYRRLSALKRQFRSPDCPRCSRTATTSGKSTSTESSTKGLILRLSRLRRSHEFKIFSKSDGDGVKERVHTHYLKGTRTCGNCGSKLCVPRVFNRHGSEYKIVDGVDLWLKVPWEK